MMSCKIDSNVCNNIEDTTIMQLKIQQKIYEIKLKK